MRVQYICSPFYELTLDQFYASMVLRQEVFIVEQNCPYLDADGKDAQSWHLLGYTADKGELAVYARLVPRGVSYPEYASIGRVVSSPRLRRKGLGRDLMRESLKRIKEHFPNVPVKISAQYYLLKFYQSFGFRAVGESYLEDDIPHIAMVRETIKS